MQVFGWNVWTSWKSPHQSVLFHAFFRYFEQMQNCQLQVDEIGYSALIRALVKGDRRDRWHLRLHTCPKIQLSPAKDMEVVPIELESVHAAMLVLEYLHRWGTPLVKLESLSLCSLFLSDFWYSIANWSWLLANMHRAVHMMLEKRRHFFYFAPCLYDCASWISRSWDRWWGHRRARQMEGLCSKGWPTWR